MSTAVQNTVQPSVGLKSQVNQLIGYIKQGRIIDAMETFYAQHVKMQENNNAPTVGLAANIERERQFVGYIKQFKGFDVDAITYDEPNGKVMIQSRLEFDAVDGKSIKADQVAVQTWQNGKIVDEKFYYDSAAT